MLYACSSDWLRILLEAPIVRATRMPHCCEDQPSLAEVERPARCRHLMALQFDVKYAVCLQQRSASRSCEFTAVIDLDQCFAAEIDSIPGTAARQPIVELLLRITHRSHRMPLAPAPQHRLHHGPHLRKTSPVTRLISIRSVCRPACCSMQHLELHYRHGLNCTLMNTQLVCC